MKWRVEPLFMAVRKKGTEPGECLVFTCLGKETASFLFLYNLTQQVGKGFVLQLFEM